jgi:hypothetical protein
MQDRKAQAEGKNLLTEIRFNDDDDEKLISIEKSEGSKQTDASANVLASADSQEDNSKDQIQAPSEFTQ